MSFPRTAGLERLRQDFSSELLKVHEKMDKLKEKRSDLEEKIRCIDAGIEIVRKYEQLDLPLDGDSTAKKAPTCPHIWDAKTEKVEVDCEKVDRPYWHCQSCLKVLFYDPAHAHEYEETTITATDGTESVVQKCTICHEDESLHIAQAAEQAEDDGDQLQLPMDEPEETEDDDDTEEASAPAPFPLPTHDQPEMTDALAATA